MNKKVSKRLSESVRQVGRLSGMIEEVHAMLLMHELLLLLLLLLLQGDFDFAAIARRTPGFVGADLAALTKEAAAVAVSRIFTEIDSASRSAAQQQQQQLMDAQQQQLMETQQQQQQQQQPLLPQGSQAAVAADAANTSAQQQQQSLQLQVQPLPSAAAAAAVAVCERMGGGPLTVSELSGLAISMSDFETALPKVQPSVRREGFTTKPDATWEDVGSLEEVGVGREAGRGCAHVCAGCVVVCGWRGERSDKGQQARLQGIEEETHTYTLNWVVAVGVPPSWHQPPPCHGINPNPSKGVDATREDIDIDVGAWSLEEVGGVGVPSTGGEEG